MFCWNYVSEGDTRLIEAISLILANHDELLEFLFCEARPELRASPEELLRRAEAFSSGERVLIRVALDVWSGSGGARLLELFEKLDQANFENVLIGMQYLGTNSSYTASLRRRQLKMHIKQNAFAN